jgi:adenylate cyclase
VARARWSEDNEAVKIWRVLQAQGESGAELAADLNRRLTWYGLFSNGVGAVFVLLFLIYLGPSRISDAEFSALLERSIPGFVAFMLVALPFGRWWAAILPFRPIDAWLRAECPAGVEERMVVLRYPFVWASRSAVIWAAGAVAFAAINVSLGWVNTIGIAAMTGLGGLASCSLQYLVVERLMRPVSARALAGGAPPENPAPGVSARLTMTWTLATGVFLLGTGGLALSYLADGQADDETRIFVAIVVLAANGLFGGLFAMLIAARSVAERLEEVTEALEDVEHGNLDTRVEVDDGSEVGLVQAGFNRMTEGLAERERLREAFGTYLDSDVADHILREGTALEGEEVEVTAMFLDVRDFTGFAERESAPVVVATLNRLFELVVPIIHGHGGHIDKFVGDGFLAVFGAPRRQRDHAEQALRAAVEIARSVEGNLGEHVRVGIGLNTGEVVAGNVGGAGRYDFSVIGDVINVAARVEAATRQTDDTILISEHTARALGGAGAKLEERPDVRLKGKRQAVAVFAAAVAADPAPTAN